MKTSSSSISWRGTAAEERRNSCCEGWKFTGPLPRVAVCPAGFILRAGRGRIGATGCPLATGPSRGEYTVGEGVGKDTDVRVLPWAIRRLRAACVNGLLSLSLSSL